MIRKLYVFIAIIVFLFAANCAFCGANGEDIGTGSDEVLVMKKDTPTAVTAAAAVTITANPADISATASAAVTATAKPETATAKPAATVKQIKKSAPAVKKKTASKKATEVISPEQQKVNSLVAEVKAKQSARKAMLCDIIIKTSYVGTGASGQEVKGKVSIKKKDKFKVQYTEPTEQFLISNGKFMWVYTPNLKQVIKQNAADAALDTNFYIEIENSIEYFVKNSKTRMEENDLVYTLVMVPKDRKKLDFDEITVSIEKTNLVPEYMSMKYDGSLSEVTFLNVKNYTAEEAALVPELSDANFEFKTPEGVEEIEASALMNAATE